MLEDARRAGFVRVRVDGVVHDLEDKITMDRYKVHTIEVVVDRLITEGPNAGARASEDEGTATSTSRLADSVETALKLGTGVIKRHDRRPRGRGRRAPVLGAPGLRQLRPVVR